VHQETKALEDLLDHVATPDQQAHQDCLVKKELQVRRVKSVLLVDPVPQDRWAVQDQGAHLDLKEHSDHQVPLDQSVNQVYRVSPVQTDHLAYQDHQEAKDRRVIWGPMDQLV